MVKVSDNSQANDEDEDEDDDSRTYGSFIESMIYQTGIHPRQQSFPYSISIEVLFTIARFHSLFSS